MTVLSWEKPKKVMSTEEWKDISADSAPPGVYVPNMSDEDAGRWKAKLTGTRKDEPQVEIRKTLHGSQMVLIVGLDGYNYKYYLRSPASHLTRTTRGLNIHLAINGPAQMTFEEMDELHEAVKEAREKLESLNGETS